MKTQPTRNSQERLTNQPPTTPTHLLIVHQHPLPTPNSQTCRHAVTPKCHFPHCHKPPPLLPFIHAINRTPAPPNSLPKSPCNPKVPTQNFFETIQFPISPLLRRKSTQNTPNCFPKQSPSQAQTLETIPKQLRTIPNCFPKSTPPYPPKPTPPIISPIPTPPTRPQTHPKENKCDSSTK